MPKCTGFIYGASQSQAREMLLQSVQSRVKTIYQAITVFNSGRDELPHLFDVDLHGGILHLSTSTVCHLTIIKQSTPRQFILSMVLVFAAQHE